MNTNNVSVNAVPEDKAYLENVNAKKWIRHMEEDLILFWDRVNPESQEREPFTTHAFSGGTPLTPEFIGEYKDRASKSGGEWMGANAGKNYSRMHSRLTFAYGVAYHLTGNPQYYEVMQKGVNYSLDNGFDEYGALTILEDRNAPENTPNLRTSQDQAYSLTGLAFFYYLTRDKGVLDRILKQHDYIMDTYAIYQYGEDGDKEKLLDFRWLPTDQASSELVAILDQLNAYMVLLYPILPENAEEDQKRKKEWKQTMMDLCQIMLDKFHVDKKKNPWNDEQITVNSFWGKLSGKELKFGGRHFDFGHFVKAWWMIYLVGKLVGDEHFEQKGEDGVQHILDDGFVDGETLFNAIDERGGNKPDSLKSESTWGEKYFPTEKNEWWVKKNISLGQHWWMHCEMDQAAAMVYKGKDSVQKWIATSNFFLNRYVDHGAGGIWHELEPATLSPKLMKAHLWKNAYHSFEHTLIMAIASEKVKKGEIDLSFAIKDGSCSDSTLRPYYFDDGDIWDIRYSTMTEGLNLRSCRVKFVFNKS
uniref:Mannose or cellobiose epimerase, N-acyl-D-glucosamine 2-epimerase family n=1 Tax=Candidatus Kentrum eta TaxID=2126337 RepID=A0A450UAE9_9GAMM|nr:MAG: hypothetical protein BECKH772A_GA0070896_1001230 [Candidatus Kentron sp. H]VFJ97233.1 MAG: hypothetical protein BECKH772C_GA0070978_1001130 [Candidatus Kentron sp. H]